LLTTVGPEGTDGSPRGDDGPVVRVLDDRTLALPDWKGNERIDSLRNIVRDGRVSLLFLVAGSNNALRVNGSAIVTADPALLESFRRDQSTPRSVIVISVAEVYSQCARALIRSALWTGGDQSAGLPTVGDMLREITEGGIDGAAYDQDWPGRAAKTMCAEQNHRQHGGANRADPDPDGIGGTDGKRFHGKAQQPEAGNGPQHS